MISVIIPTYNRAEILSRTLMSMEKQDFSYDRFEVIVVDDGSHDDTASLVEKFKKAKKINLEYYRLDNGGPARARNLGIEKAKGEILLFCGDDVIYAKDVLSQHYISHKRYPGSAVLGIILWDKDINPTDFMRFIAPNGPQFRYHTIKNVHDARFNHFYGSHISLDKKWLGNIRFDQIFKYPAAEDIELGFLLEKKGLKIIYNKNAKGYHCHYHNTDSFYMRMNNVGKNIAIFRNKYKDNKKDLFKIYHAYAPFMMFPFGLRLFNAVSGIMGKSGVIKKASKRLHWLSNISYFYSAGILKELKNGK